MAPVTRRNITMFKKDVSTKYGLKRKSIIHLVIKYVPKADIGVS